MLLASIRHCLKNLLRFSGRDSRALFWPYAFAIFCLMSVAGYAWMMFMIQRIMQFALAHPADTTIMTGPSSVSIRFTPGHPFPVSDFQAIIVGLAIGAAIFVALTAAAVCRRLHDRGRTGLWGLLPAAFLTLSFTAFPRLMADASLDGGVPALFPIVFLSNLAYLGSLVALVIMLAGAGTPGANRFGPDPAADTE